MSYSFYDFIGNVGVFMLLSAYLLLQLNKLSSKGLCYSLLNGVGATLIIISLIFEFNLSAFIIEFFWLLISLFGTFDYFRKKKQPQAEGELT